MRGDGVDAAVTQLLLAAIEPAQLTIALEAVEHLEAQARAIDHQWHLRLERARYEADRPGGVIRQWSPNTAWSRGVSSATGMRSSASWTSSSATTPRGASGGKPCQ